jgi:hypothetical protein
MIMPGRINPSVSAQIPSSTAKHFTAFTPDGSGLHLMILLIFTEKRSF